MAAKFLLPANLAEALSLLESEQLAALTEAVEAENRRRHGPPRLQAQEGSKTPDAADRDAGLPAAKANLVRASAASGMKPTAIARLTGVPIATINKVLRAADPRR